MRAIDAWEQDWYSRQVQDGGTRARFEPSHLPSQPPANVKPTFPPFPATGQREAYISVLRKAATNSSPMLPSLCRTQQQPD